MSALTEARDRLAEGYYNSLPKNGGNPGGLAANGHQTNFPAAMIDLGLVLIQAALDAQAQADAMPAITAGVEARAGAEAARDLAKQYRDEAEEIVGFDASDYLKKVGGTITGLLKLASADPAGFLSFVGPDGTRLGLVRIGEAPNTLSVAGDNGFTFDFAQRPSFAGSVPWDALNLAPVDLASAQVITGRKALVGGVSAMATATVGLGAAEFRAGVGGAAMVELNRNGTYVVYLGVDTDNVLKVGGGSLGANAYKIWHSGNDGSGSGSDSDMLRGLIPAVAGTANTVVSRDGQGGSAFGVVDTPTVRNGAGNLSIQYGTANRILTHAGGVVAYGSSQAGFIGTWNDAFRVIDEGSVLNGYTSLGFTILSNANTLARVGMSNSTTGSWLVFGTSNNYALGVTNSALVIDPNGAVSMSGPLTVQGALVGGSDQKWKTDIELLGRVRGLTPKIYVRDGRLHYGYIAQDVLEDAPPVVFADAEGSLHLEILGMLAAVHSQLQGNLDDLAARLKAAGL